MMGCLLRHLQKKYHLDEQCANNESMLMMVNRWQRLYDSFFNGSRFDTSKVPDLYDYMKYDVIHNTDRVMPIAVPLFSHARDLAAFVVPREYGMTPEEVGGGEAVAAVLRC